MGLFLKNNRTPPPLPSHSRTRHLLSRCCRSHLLASSAAVVGYPTAEIKVYLSSGGGGAGKAAAVQQVEAAVVEQVEWRWWSRSSGTVVEPASRRFEYDLTVSQMDTFKLHGYHVSLNMACF